MNGAAKDGRDMDIEGGGGAVACGEGAAMDGRGEDMDEAQRVEIQDVEIAVSGKMFECVIVAGMLLVAVVALVAFVLGMLFGQKYR